MRSRIRRALFGPDAGDDALHLADILRQETVGGLLMLAATLAALVWANAAPAGYAAVAHARLGPLTLAHWASDGLLTIFFFVAGLELKRELVEGSLSQPGRALVPIAAALCGMALPALLYLGVTTAGHGDPRGWAIPMATDIAFALAVLAIVGSRLPPALRAFLLTLAVVDDLGAIIVIATVYTTTLRLPFLAGAAAVLLAWWLLQRARVDRWPLFAALGVAAWWLTLQSGVHATIAGVACGLLTRTSASESHDPVDRWEHAVRPVSAGVAVPVFALLAAGVHVRPADLAGLVTHPVPLGILVALVVGKVVGVFAGAFGAARATGSAPSPGVHWRDVLATAQLAGIGFTVSLLLCELAFPEAPAEQAQAKAAVLVASGIAAVVGGTALRRRNARRRPERPESSRAPDRPDRLSDDQRKVSDDDGQR